MKLTGIILSSMYYISVSRETKQERGLKRLPGDEGQGVTTCSAGSFVIRLQIDNAAAFRLHCASGFYFSSKIICRI